VDLQVDANVRRDILVSSSKLIPEYGVSIFHRNFSIYHQVHTALQPGAFGNIAVLSACHTDYMINFSDFLISEFDNVCFTKKVPVMQKCKW
jgi:hypothetical protein